MGNQVREHAPADGLGPQRPGQALASVVDLGGQVVYEAGAGVGGEPEGVGEPLDDRVGVAGDVTDRGLRPPQRRRV